MTTQEIFIKSSNSAVREIRFYPAQMVIKIVGKDGLEKIDLGYASSRLLELLISKVGMLVEREEILKYAWNGRVVSQNNLNQSIRFIRDILHDEIAKDVIQTVPRRGYMFNPEYLLRGDIAELVEFIANSNESVQLPTVMPVLQSAQIGVVRLFSGWKEVLLSVLCFSQFFLLNSQIDYELFFSERPGFLEEFVSGNRFIYVGNGQSSLEDLKERFSSLLSKFPGGSVQGAVVVFSKMHNFYEVSCLSAEGKAGALYFHASRIDFVVEQELTECLR